MVGMSGVDPLTCACLARSLIGLKLACRQLNRVYQWNCNFNSPVMKKNEK